MKINCLSASIVTALLMAISVFLANVGHTEYKSQIRKRKNRALVSKIERVDVDYSTTSTQENNDITLTYI